jgi:hypothetical protein
MQPAGPRLHAFPLPQSLDGRIVAIGPVADLGAARPAAAARHRLPTPQADAKYRFLKGKFRKGDCHGPETSGLP